MIFDDKCEIVSSHQLEHTQIYPKPGWVEHDPLEIWEKVEECVKCALESAGLSASDISGIGITNQRESTLVWNRRTSIPYYNVVVWNDARTSSICDKLKKDGGGADRFRSTTGLPVAPYFSATKLAWLMESVPGLREDAQAGEALFGTIDTWLLWKLTGGAVYITDVTNASRTMMMDLATLDWSPSILHELGFPRQMLPEIKSSSEIYGTAVGLLAGVPIAGVLGDQQAALVGQTCFDSGTAKCTYGTGSFVLLNTGEKPFTSTKGLLTTVGYKLGKDAPCVYALEGSISYAGSTVQWCRDALGIIKDAKEIETLARTVNDNGGVYFVPAFGGLFAPYWRMDARGTICGLTAYNTKAHIARAVLEATAFQVEAVLRAMKGDSGVSLQILKVDGGMTANSLLMQFQSDMVDVPVQKPRIGETTALGAAFAAGLAVGVWRDTEQLRAMWILDWEHEPSMPQSMRAEFLAGWSKAIGKAVGWEEPKTQQQTGEQVLTPRRARHKRGSRGVNRGAQGHADSHANRDDHTVIDASPAPAGPAPRWSSNLWWFSLDMILFTASCAALVGYAIGKGKMESRR